MKIKKISIFYYGLQSIISTIKKNFPRFSTFFSSIRGRRRNPGNNGRLREKSLLRFLTRDPFSIPPNNFAGNLIESGPIKRMGFCRISTSPSFIPPPSPERRISSIVRRNRSNVSTPRVIVTPGNSRRTSVSLLPAGCASCHHRISRCAPNTCPYTSNEYCSPVSPVFVFYKLTPRA